MKIPVLPMTSDEDNDIILCRIRFDVFTPKTTGEISKMTSVKGKSQTEEDKVTALVIDVKGLQRRNLNDVLLKRLRIRGMRTWFMTNIESVDDVFDAFNTDAEAVLVPVNTVRSEEEFEDILSVSDSAIPVVMVRKRGTVFIGESIDYIKAIRKAFAAGFTTVAVFDLDDSLTEENWTYLMDEGDIIPCSFNGKIKGERFEELGFGRCFTVPE